MKCCLVPVILVASGLILAGCTPPESSTEKKDNTGVFGKTTKEVGEFDATAGEKVSDSTIDQNRLATPLIGAAAAYGPVVEKVVKMKVGQAIEFFRADKGRYPKDHKEFMSGVIEYYQIDLPLLPGGNKYQYDVENHELVVIVGDGKADLPNEGN